MAKKVVEKEIYRRPTLCGWLFQSGIFYKKAIRHHVALSLRTMVEQVGLRKAREMLVGLQWMYFMTAGDTHLQSMVQPAWQGLCKATQNVHATGMDL